MDSTTTNDTPFNMAMLYYMRMSKLMDAKDDAAINGNVEVWFSCLRTIYRNIFFKLDIKDKKDLNKLFDKSRELLSTQTLHTKSAARIKDIAISSSSHILDEIDCKIMFIMDKKRMIFPSIEIKGLQQLNSRYKLDIPKAKI